MTAKTLTTYYRQAGQHARMTIWLISPKVGQHPRIKTLNYKLSRWVNIPERWVNIKQNAGSAWNRIYKNSIDKIAFFDYQEGRGWEGAMDILENFKGYLHADIS